MRPMIQLNDNTAATIRVTIALPQPQ